MLIVRKSAIAPPRAILTRSPGPSRVVGGRAGSTTVNWTCNPAFGSPPPGGVYARSSDAIAFASQRFPEAEFICGEVPRALGTLLAEAKVVLMMDVLEHVEDDFEIFSAVAAETRAGTSFLLTVPAEPALWSKPSPGHARS